MSSPLLMAWGILAICCFVLSEQQLITVLAKVTGFGLTVPILLRNLRRQLCHESDIINKPKSPGGPVSTTGDYNSRCGHSLRPTGILEYNLSYWTVMAFRLVILMSLLGIFARGWPSPRVYSEFPERIVKHLVSSFHRRIFMLSRSS